VNEKERRSGYSAVYRGRQSDEEWARLAELLGKSGTVLEVHEKRILWDARVAPAT
jgi:hypothetical protein